MAEASKDKKSTSIHAGHKKRLRERFAINNDFTGFSDHEILEFLLNYGNVRKNTNTTAHLLLERFKTVTRVINATREELMSIDGIGDYTATLLLMQRSLLSKYNREMNDMKNVKVDSKNFIKYMCSLFTDSDVEKVYMLCVNGSGKVTDTVFLGRGIDDSVLVDNKKLIMEIINHNAKSIILLHNHPTGVLTPSSEDIKSTKKLKDMLEEFGVCLLEHFIVYGHECQSVLCDARYQYL